MEGGRLRAIVREEIERVTTGGAGEVPGAYRSNWAIRWHAVPRGPGRGRQGVESYRGVSRAEAIGRWRQDVTPTPDEALVVIDRVTDEEAYDPQG